MKVGRAAPLSERLDECLHRLARDLGYEFGSVTELAPDGSRLHFRSLVGWPLELMAAPIPAQHRSIAGYVAMTGQTLISPDFSNDARYGHSAASVKLGIRQVLGEPIRCAGAIWGSLVLQTTNERPIDAGALSALREIAKEIGELVGTSDSTACGLDVEELHRALQHMPTGVIVAEPSGRVVLRNHRIDEFFGIVNTDPESWPDLPQAYRHGTLLPLDQLPLHRALKGGDRVSNFQLDLRGVDGRVRTLNVSATPIYDEGGRVAGAVEVSDDITDRRERDDRHRPSSTLPRARRSNLGQWRAARL